MSVLLATSIVAFLLTAGIGVVRAADHADTVRVARQPAFASPDATPALWGMPDAIVADGMQVPIVWLERGRVVDTRHSIVPPGLRELPAPGTVVVSPALLAAGVDARRLGLEPSTVGTGPGGTIGREGLVTASDPIAYVTPRSGHTLTASESALHLAGYDPHASPDTRFALEASPFMISRNMAFFLLVWLILLPGSLAVVAVSQAYSELRDERMTMLHRMGVRNARLNRLGRLEAVFLAVPGAALGAGIAVAVSGRLALIPGTGTQLWDGDAAVPWPAGVGVVAGILLLTTLASSRGRTTKLRDRRVRAHHVVRVLPLVLGIAMMFASSLLPQGVESRALPLLSGLLITTFGVPMAIPVLTAWLGRLLSRSDGVTPWLVGRRLEVRASSLSRPAAAGAALIFIAGCATASQQAGDDAPEPFPPTPNVYVAGWIGSDPAALDRARATHPDWEIAAMGPDGVSDSCRERSATCVDGHLSSELVIRLSERQVGVSRAAVTHVDGALIITPGTVADADLIGALGGPTRVVIDRWSDPGSSAGVAPAWIDVTSVIAAAIFTLLILREAGERTLMAAVHDRPLQRQNITPHRLERIRWSSMTLPMIVGLPIGVTAAVAFAFFGRGSGITRFELWRVSAVGALCCGGAIVVVTCAMLLARRIDSRVVMRR